MITPIPSVSVAGGGAAAGIRSDGANQTPGASGFVDSIGDALNDMGAAEAKVDEAALSAATGDISSVNDYMIASAEAQLTTEITVAVRNRAIESFNDIMRMQV